MSEHGLKMNHRPGDEPASEQISELMGLLVACGMMIGAIIGVMIVVIGMSGRFEAGTDVLVGALAGAAVWNRLSLGRVSFSGKGNPGEENPEQKRARPPSWERGRFFV